MFEFKPYINLKNGEKQEFQCNLKCIEEDGAVAVYINAISYDVFDDEFGCGIDFEIDSIESYMADYRHSEFWCKPVFGNDCSEIPDETQGLIYRKKDKTFGVILPVVSKEYKCVLKGCEKNSVTAKLFSWYENMHCCNALAFVYAEGKNPYELLEKCASMAVKHLNNGCKTRNQRRYPEIFEYLGWCSWDAFEIRVSEDDLVKKCEEFQKKNIPVKWAIIDDMWGEVRDFYDFEYKNRTEMFKLMHSSKVYSFNADPKRFPNGLKNCINKINSYGIRVGMWHPTTGYWMGIDPSGDIYKELKGTLIRTADGRYIHSYEQEKAYKYYSTFHDYLQSCGAEFVKIDNQSMTQRYYKKLAPVGVAASSFHKAMEASVGQHFDNAMINCMGMASEDWWNRSVSPISRCSDDFQPENRAWFIKHIMQCSYNDLIQGQLYYCDWDMWWTDDGQAVKNSVMRAISGGPIYISDKLGRSNPDILKPLILSDGKILRCDRPAMPTADCITVDPTKSGKIFKLQNIANDSGIMAVFNLDAENNAVAGSICAAEVEGLEGERFVLYEHFSQSYTVLGYDEKMDITLNDSNSFRLYIIVPIKDGFATIGRTDKFISPKTIKYVKNGEIELFENGPYAYYKNGKLVLLD